MTESPPSGAAPAPASTERKQITTEDILRSPTGVSDLTRMWTLLLQEVPHPARTDARLVALTLGEVASQVAVAVVGKLILDGALAPTPVLDGRLAAAGVALSLVNCLFVRARQLSQGEVALEFQPYGVRRLAHSINGAQYEDLAVDTTPLKPLEALACGLPMLVSDLPAMRELLGRRPDVRFVEPEPAPLADALVGFTRAPWAGTGEIEDRARKREVHAYGAVYDHALAAARPPRATVAT